MKSIGPIKYSSYRQANFIVLKAPDIPSVLVETAYITNKRERVCLIEMNSERVAKPSPNPLRIISNNNREMKNIDKSPHPII